MRKSRKESDKPVKIRAASEPLRPRVVDVDPSIIDELLGEESRLERIGKSAGEQH